LYILAVAEAKEEEFINIVWLEEGTKEQLIEAEERHKKNKLLEGKIFFKFKLDEYTRNKFSKLINTFNDGVKMRGDNIL
jgi:hypothetical protein